MAVMFFPISPIPPKGITRKADLFFSLLLPTAGRPDRLLLVVVIYTILSSTDLSMSSFFPFALPLKLPT
jgi:hypothetical protein